MARWLITNPRQPGSPPLLAKTWEEHLGHPLRGPVVLKSELAEEAIQAFAEREGIPIGGLAAMRV